MRAIEFIFESYPLAKKEFSQVAKPDVVQTTIDQYRELVRKNQFRNPEEKNINHWRRLGWEAFSQMIKVKSNDVTDTQRKRGKVVGNAITLQDDAEWVVLVPLDKEASVHYGRGTEWCTTKPQHSFYENYVYNRNITLIYAIDKTRTGKSVAISIEPPKTSQGEQIEMFNQKDLPIDANKYKEISGLDSAKFIQMAKLPENQQQLTDSIEKYKVAKAKTAELLAASPLDPEAIERELKITKDSEDCYEYTLAYGQEQNRRIAFHPIILTAAASSISNMFFSAEENAIELGQYIDFSNITMSVFKSILRTSPSLFTYNFKLLSNEQQQAFSMSAASAYEYADKILGKKPFPAGEPAIAADAATSVSYARYILHNTPFPAGEAAIASSAIYSTDYAIKVLKKPFPAGEPEIASSAMQSYLYAKEFFTGIGWPPGEPEIVKDISYAFRYAVDVLDHKRFLLAEPKFAKDGQYALQYAIDILDAPFPAGEPAIFSSKWYPDQYARLILKNHRSPSWEQLIKDDSKKSLDYALARNQPFPAGETAIARDTWYSYKYAEMINKPFPEGEAAIATSAECSYKYASKILNKPFPAGETVIARDKWYAKKYTNEVLAYYRSPSWEQLIKDDPIKSLDYALARNQPFPAGEPAILSNDETCLEYTLSILTTHHSPSWENLIKDDAEEAYNYAVFTKKRFPAGEPAIASALGFAKHYDKKFGTNLSQQ